MSFFEDQKERLQFTGWLQYIPTGAMSLVLILIAKVIALFGYVNIALGFGLAAGLLFLVLLFEIVTVKLHLHPREPLPKPYDTGDIFDLMRRRVSCRSFQNRKLTSDHQKEIIKLIGAPREMNNGTTSGKEPIRFEYIAEKLTVWPVVGASEFIVAIAPKAYNRQAIIDIGHSLQKIVLEATHLGIATCWIGPGADQSSIMKHLGKRFDPDKDHIICVCAVGYKSWYKPLMLHLIQKVQRNRLPLSSLFFTEPALENSLAVEASPFNQFGRCYEVCQWSPSAFNGQTTRCACVTENKEGSSEAEISIVRFDFFAATKSRFYAAIAVGIWCANWESGCQAQGINGHFTLVPAEDRDTDQELPRYDISWVLDK